MKDAILTIDRISKQKGKTIYQLIYELMQNDLNEERARQWLKNIH